MFGRYGAYVNIYRVYDVAYEADLNKAFEILSNKNPNKYKLKKHTRDMVLNEAPLSIELGESDIDFEGELTQVRIYGKIWSYGAVSIRLKLGLKENTSFARMNRFIDYLETSNSLEELALGKTQEVADAIQTALEKPNVSEHMEDYTIIQFVSGHDAPVEESLKEEFYRLLEGEGDIKLSRQTRESIRQSTFQYCESDMAVIDWNRALLLGEQSDVEELSDILEFAVCQLLELRYYDDLLDQKLASLYSSLEEKKSAIWKNKYSSLSEDAALVYIEFSEVIDKVGNSLKMVGDTYYAKIFRAAIEKFRINDWKSAVMQKLNNLARLSELFSNEINERRNQLMELIIIILIAIEVIPFLYNLFF